VRYYEYISTAKLEMLFPQVPRSLWERFAVDVSLKTRYLDAGFKLNDEQATQVYMLNRVISHLEKLDLIGSVDSSKPYVRGMLEMRWMHLADAPGVAIHRVGADHQRRRMHLLAEPGIVFWAGYHPRRMKKKAQTVIGLGGSIKHVIGAREVDGCTDTGAPSLINMGSFIDPILWYLAEPLREVPLINPSARPSRPLLDMYGKPVLLRDGTPYIPDKPIGLDNPAKRDITLDTVSLTAYSMFEDDYYGPTRSLEFVAKRLAVEESKRKRIVLATPLYVAHV